MIELISLLSPIHLVTFLFTLLPYQEAISKRVLQPELHFNNVRSVHLQEKVPLLLTRGLCPIYTILAGSGSQTVGKKNTFYRLKWSYFYGKKKTYFLLAPSNAEMQKWMHQKFHQKQWNEILSQSKINSLLGKREEEWNSNGISSYFAKHNVQSINANTDDGRWYGPKVKMLPHWQWNKIISLMYGSRKSKVKDTVKSIVISLWHETLWIGSGSIRVFPLTVPVFTKVYGGGHLFNPKNFFHIYKFYSQTICSHSYVEHIINNMISL